MNQASDHVALAAGEAVLDSSDFPLSTTSDRDIEPCWPSSPQSHSKLTQRAQDDGLRPFDEGRVGRGTEDDGRHLYVATLVQRKQNNAKIATDCLLQGVSLYKVQQQGMHVRRPRRWLEGCKLRVSNLLITNCWIKG